MTRDARGRPEVNVFQEYFSDDPSVEYNEQREDSYKSEKDNAAAQRDGETVVQEAENRHRGG